MVFLEVENNCVIQNYIFFNFIISFKFWLECLPDDSSILTILFFRNKFAVSTGFCFENPPVDKKNFF